MHQNSSDARSMTWHGEIDDAVPSKKTLGVTNINSATDLNTMDRTKDVNSLASSRNSIREEKELEQSKSLAVMTSSVFRKPPLRGLQKLQARNDKRTSEFHKQPLRSVEQYAAH